MEDFEIADRVMYTEPKSAYVTLKDHKPNFENDPKCRLINPSKIEIGKLSQQILSRVVDTINQKTKLNLFNSDSVVQWFEKSENKQNLKLIVFDICDYYGSITKQLFIEAVNWAKTMTTITDKEEKVIFDSKQSLLSDGGSTWKKKGDPNFYIQMGSWDGAESTVLVGLYLLSKLKHLGVDAGLYRDDGLILSRLTARRNELLKNELVKIFNQYNLEVNKSEFFGFDSGSAIWPVHSFHERKQLHSLCQ